jgi:hypothetical protein
MLPLVLGFTHQKYGKPPGVAIETLTHIPHRTINRLSTPKVTLFGKRGIFQYIVDNQC